MTPDEGRSAVVEGLDAVRGRITAAAVAAARNPGEITLVAVSKMQPAEAVTAAIAAGQRCFGENRVQEALGKFRPLRDATPDLSLHLIGPLQTNKVRDAVELFDVIQSVDRLRLAEALAAELSRTGRPLRLMIQVNTGEEPQKAGILPGDADAFITDCRERLDLPVDGLMCVPPLGEEPALHFALLREVSRRHGLTMLSMGMSGDFETALRFGATHVRIGTAIFGHRSASA